MKYHMRTISSAMHVLLGVYNSVASEGSSLSGCYVNKHHCQLCLTMSSLDGHGAVSWPTAIRYIYHWLS